LSKRPALLAGEKLPPEPRQKRSRENLMRLKSAALALFQEKGYEKTSIIDIAKRADVAVGGFYLHFRSKRQLLLALMDELLERLSRLDLGLQGAPDVRAGLHSLLSRSFSSDFRYLGAYRAWQEAALSDPVLAKKQQQIHAWTTRRVKALFEYLQKMPGARQQVDISGLARAMDVYFWSLLGQAAQMGKPRLRQSIDSATHLIYHAIFSDRPLKPGRQRVTT
jgi:AcrR family transcriptional regulator